MPLTVRQIESAKPADKDYKLSDGQGLYLLIKKSGARYWNLKYRFAGKEKKLVIGVYRVYHWLWRVRNGMKHVNSSLKEKILHMKNRRVNMH